MSEPTPSDAAPEAPAPPQGALAQGSLPEGAPPRKRGRETARDMVLSMGVILVPVLILVFVVARQPSPDPVRTVDASAAATAAAAAAPFPVMVPTGSPATWRATSARYERVPGASAATVWHLGLITPHDTYAGVEQTDADATAFLRDLVPKTVPAGEVELAGSTWTRYTVAANGYRTLVRPADGSTLIVTGSASWPDLEELAASLRPLPNNRPSAAPSASASG